MPEIVISNAGPRITLAKVGRFHLLHDLFGQIVVPQAVFHEVAHQGAGQAGAYETQKAEWIEKRLVNDQLAVELLREELGLGESEAIVLAQESTATLLLLDDALARRKASRLGLAVIGTLGVLLLAKNSGLIDAVRPVLDELSQTDFRASRRVYDEVLIKAGEHR